MNADFRGVGPNVGRVRIWAVAAGLLVAAFLILGGGSGLLHNTPGPDSLSSGLAIAPAAPEMGVQGVSPVALKPAVRGLLSGLPLMFEPNQGQAGLDPADSRARFVARGPGYGLFLGSEGAILSLHSRTSSARVESQNIQTVVTMKLAGATANTTVTGVDRLPGKSNYFIGNDPAKWRTDIPQFARVRYENVYPGINLVFYGNQGRLEYDFRVAPGADPSQAELQFDGAHLDVKDGALVVYPESGSGHPDGNSVRMETPRVYQEIAGREQPVAASFVLRGGNRAGFELGDYDRSRELVIDPVLVFSTYFGGPGDELNNSVAVQGGFIYLAGSTTSTTTGQLLPGITPGVIQPLPGASGAQNVYIVKIQPPQGTIGASVVYLTYLGGTGPDTPVGIAVDDGGNAYVAGTTSSSNFPTTSTAYQTTPSTPGLKHVFVTKLNSTATAPLVYSSYLSGNGNDVASGMTIDSSGDIFVTGTTESNNGAIPNAVEFPASTLPQGQAFQPLPVGSIQFFLTKVNTNAITTGSIAYSTYFGGGTAFTTPPIATGGGVVVDNNGNIYFTGTTNFTFTGSSPTTDFPILNAYQPCLDQPPSGVIVGAPTCTTSAATSSASDAFVAKLNPNALNGQQQLQFSTYVGGAGTDTGTGIALDPNGAANVYITGTTNSQPFENTVFPSYQPCLNDLFTLTGTTEVCTTGQTNPPSDAYVAKLGAAVSGTTANVPLNYFSYLGGANNETGLAIAVDDSAGALLTGSTQSPTTSTGTKPPASGDFPVLACAAVQCNFNPTQDAFLARINTAAVTGSNTTASWVTYFGGDGAGEGTSIALDANQIAYFAGDTNSTDLLQASHLVAPLQAQNNGGSDATLVQVGSASGLTLTGVLTLGTNQTFISAGNPATFTYTLTNNGADLASGITVTDNLSPDLTSGVQLTFVSASTTSGSCNGSTSSTTISCSIISLQAGSSATITIVVTPTANAAGGETSFTGGTVVATATNSINSATTTVTATMSDFTMTPNPPSVTLQAAGDAAKYQILLKPNPVYGSPISLSVSGLPAGSSSSFSQSTVTLVGSPGTPTLTISTTPRPIVTGTAKRWSGFYALFYTLWLPVPLTLLGLGTDRKRRRIAAVLTLCFGIALLLLQPACGHTTTQPPVSGTPAGTYTLTLTATSGTDSKSAPIQLVVP